MSTHSPHRSVDDNKALKQSMERKSSHAQGTIVPVDGPSDINHSNMVLLEDAIESIGFGKFQWQLTILCGFGFLVDQMLLVSISLVTPQAAMEFGPRYATLLSASQYAGLLVGAIVLGALADNIGRKLVWQLSIVGVSIFAMIAASSPSWAALNVFVTFTGLFSGGNLAIDLTLLAECIPRRWRFILSGLATIWGLGNTITGLIAWPLLVNFGCPSGSIPATCSKADNMGWRYLYITLGGLCLVMAMLRVLLLRAKESPRWLMSCGRIAEAVDVLNGISAVNQSTYHATIDQFIIVDGSTREVLSVRDNIQRAAKLFSGRQQMILMLCLIPIWALIGIAYPLYTIFLPYYLASHGASFGEQSNYITYRDWTVSSVVGILGPFLSMYLVSLKLLRSRRSMLLCGVACAAFSGAFTSVRTAGQNLAFSCMINFWLNALYSIIYSYTPQALSVENRGLGNGLLMAVGRVASLSAPFIATFSDVTTSAPIWVSCGCYIVIGVIALVLPVDTVPF